jgi:hypothetical protein
MTDVNKRQLLLALAAISGYGASPALAQTTTAAGACSTFDLPGGDEIGAAWRAANPDADLAALRAELLPDGLCEEALAPIGARVKADFRNGALFIYRGWRLSQTEAQLFALAG